MRMDGDPHLTAWGSLDGERIGGQRAVDLIPPQVVGGYFLMGTEEKGRHPEIPDEQGGPVSCQGDQALLQPLGVVEGQLGGGHGQPGEENDPLALSSSDLPQDSARNPSSCCAPGSPSEAAQVPDQSVSSPFHPPQGDRPSEYQLDAHQPLVPELSKTDPLPQCPPVTGGDDQIPMPSNGLLGLDETLLFTSKTHQESDCEPLSFDYLTPQTDQILPAESCLPRTDDHSLLSEPSVAPGADQSPQSALILDPSVVESPQSGSNLDLGDVGLPQSGSWLDYGAAQVSLSEYDLGDVELPQSSSRIYSGAAQLPQSQSNLDLGDVDLLQSGSQLDSDSAQVPRSESDLGDIEMPRPSSQLDSSAAQVSQSEYNLGDVDFPQSNSLLDSDAALLPQSECNLGDVDLPQSESNLDLGDVDLPQSESNLDLCDVDLPQPDSGTAPLSQSEFILGDLLQSSFWLESGAARLPQPESNLVLGVVGLPHASSWLDSSSVQLPQSESCLDPDSLQLTHSPIHSNFDTDRLSRSQSRFCPVQVPQYERCLVSDVDELPEAEICLDLTAGELPEADSCVNADANDLAEAEAFLDLEGELPEAEACLSLSDLPESDICLSPGIGDLPEAEVFAVPDVSELPEAESFLNPDVGELPEAEAGLNIASELTEAESGSANVTNYISQSCLQFDVDQLPQPNSCLVSEQSSLAESCLHPDANQFFFSEPCLDQYDSDLLPQGKLCLDHNSDLLPKGEPCLDHDDSDLLPQCEPWLDHDDSDLLPQSEPCLTAEAAHLTQIESTLHSATYKSAQSESCVDHNMNHLKSNLISGTEQIAQYDNILNPDTNELPRAMVCLDSDSNLFPQVAYCLHPNSGPSPMFYSSLFAEPDRLPQSEPYSTSGGDQILLLSQTGTNLAADTEKYLKGESCLAPELETSSQSESDLGQNSDHSAQLAHCDSHLMAEFDQGIVSICPQPDHNQSSESDCLLIPKFVRCSQSEPYLDTDKLSQANSYLEHETVQFSQSELSLVPSACEKSNSGSCLISVIDHLSESGSCLDSDIKPLRLSETFLAHEDDQFICSLSELGSETTSSADQMPLFSDFAEKEMTGSEATHSDHLATCERPLANNNDLLPVSESGLCDDTEFLCLCETFLACDPDQLSLPAPPEAPHPDNLPLSEPALVHESNQSDLPNTPDIDSLPLSDSVLACDTDHFHLGESFLPQDALPFTVATNTDQLDGLHEAYLDSDSEQCLRPESCLNDDSDYVSLSDSSVSHNTHEMPLSDPPLPANDVDQLPTSEPFFTVNTADQLPLCMTSVDNASHLPLLASYLGLDHDNLSKFDANLHNHLPSSASVFAGEADKFIESSTGHLSDQLQKAEYFPDIDTLHLSEYFLPPNFDDLTLSDLCLTSDIDRFPLDVTPLDPDAGISLFDELLASDANQSLIPDSIVTPASEKLLLSCMSAPPHDHQLPISDPSALLKKDNVQLCESLVSPNVDQSLSESFVESNTNQLPQPLSYSVSDVDQSESAYRPFLDPATDFAQVTPANTSFSNSIVEEFQIPWDWTSDLDQAELTGVGSDCDPDIYLNASPGDPDDHASQAHETDDCFPLFCLDTPPESPISSPEIDPLNLSDDILSLCDVFSQLHANDMTCSEMNSELCCDLDSLSLHQADNDFRTDRVPIIEEETLSQVNAPQSADLPHMHSSSGQADLNIGGTQAFSGTSDNHLLDNDIDQSESYCLDLLFEPKLVSCKTRSSSNGSIVDPCPQEPTFRSTSSTNAPGHLLCDVTKPSQSHVYETPSTPALESLCFGDGFSPACPSDPPNLHLAQSHSNAVTEMGSASELLVETVQLPLAVGEDPLDLLDGISENNQDVLLAQEALTPDKSIDAPIQGEGAPPDFSEEPDHGPVSAGLSGEQCPANDTARSKASIDLTSPPLPGGIAEQFEELALSPTLSPLENTQVLPSDCHQPADPQDSASAPFSFGEGDPFLGFALDNDSPCVGDELARLRAVFDALDRDKDGFVKMEDFVQFATVYGAEQVKYLTGYLDPAGLGVINFRDFYRGISEIQNEDLDMQLYDMGYPSEGEPACSVDFDDLAAFEVTEVTDSAYVGSESAYSECETFTDEDTGGLAAQEDPETEGDGASSRGHTSASPEGLELSLCDISVVTVSGQEEQFEDFGEGAEPDLYNSHCEDEPDTFTHTSNGTQRLTSSPDKRTCSRKEARRLHHSGFLGEDPVEVQQTEMAYDETDLTDKVLYLEQRVSELERDAATTSEQQNRLRQENLHLLHRAHALEEQLKDQELRSDEVQGEETRKHRDELRKMERDRSYRLTSLKARLQELESENLDLRSQLPGFKATTQRLEEEKYKLLDQVEDLQLQLQDHQDQNIKLGGKLSKEMHKQQTEKERCQEVIEELRRELEQMQLIRLEMEQKMGLGNSAALQEYNSRTREAELEQEVRRLKQEQRALKEQNEELNGQIINLSIQGAKNLFSTTFSDSLAAEISSVSRDELMEAIQKQEEINLRLQDYIDRIIVAIMETNPAILEVNAVTDLRP